MNRVTIDSSYIKTAFSNQTKRLQAFADKDLSELPFIEIENEARVRQEALLDDWGKPTFGRVRIRSLPRGSLLRLRTSGIYIPHVFEGHIDNGIYYKQKPFTLAHEMAHGYGYTDESVCNFIGYLTCTQSDLPQLQYSAELAYWRYLAKYYKYWYPEQWQLDYEQLHPDIKEDLAQIRHHILRYKDIMPKMRDVIYDNYLKSHGVKAGIKSYDEMIHLVAAYRAK